MMGKTIWTCGYGNMATDDFVKKLKDAGVTIVLDVRRKGSKSWNGKYNHGYSTRLTVGRGDINYEELPHLANVYDTLDAYREWLNIRAGKEEIELLAAQIEDDHLDDTLCFLCSEGKPYEKDGVTPRCHRVYVAEALVDQLGEGWRCVHL